MSRFTVVSSIAAMLLLLAGCNGGYTSPTSPSTSPPPQAGPNVSVSIVGMYGASSFSPNPVNATVGQSVTWSNGDSTTHRVVANDGSFDTGNIAPGTTSAAVTVSKVGSIPYHCSLHPEMVGTLVVK